jgi:rod shape-determining protein MreC
LQKSNVIYHLIIAAIFILLEVAALNMLRNNGRLQNIWISKCTHAVMGTIWGSSQEVKQYFSLKTRNAALAQDNHDLRVRLAELEAMISDGGAAGRSVPADGIAGGFRYTPATIVKISNNTQHNYMILDKGSSDGVKEGNGVITAKGAVGIIEAVSENYSYALSFKNHQMSISARLRKDGPVGTMNWDGKSQNKALLKEIPHHIDRADGDTVYTSGYSSMFPADIPLGITGASKIVNGATYEIEISLFEDMSSLRYAIIVDNLDDDEIETLEAQKQ